MKKSIRFLSRISLMCLAFVIGASSGVLMAAASGLPDAGVTSSGDPTSDVNGIATETAGREDGEEGFYLKEIDKRVTKIRPMSTPVDQISRYAKSSHSKSFEVKFYSVGTREIKCTTTAAVTAMTSGASTSLPVSDSNMFTIDDTIRVVGVRAITDPKGNVYASEDSNVPDLVLCICGQDSSTSAPTVFAVNGGLDSNDQPILVPAIAKGTTLIRMGKACGELDAQTGCFNNKPKAEIQYCQNFMIQVEQSTFDKIAAKEVEWTFSDLEEDSIYDMRVTMENTFLFGAKGKINNPAKNGMATWFTQGIWWMAGKDVEVGSWSATDGRAVITEANLVDITKELFVGTGVGNKRKILFCGSDFLSALQKIESKRNLFKDSVEVWGLKFKSCDTNFGEILAIHHEMFDLNGMSDCALSLDPAFLEKKVHSSWGRNVLDLKTAGIRNSNATVIQEVSCLTLRYAKAHARMKLAKAPVVDDSDDDDDQTNVQQTDQQS